jgi:hypothetical protein
MVIPMARMACNIELGEGEVAPVEKGALGQVAFVCLSLWLMLHVHENPYQPPLKKGGPSELSRCAAIEHIKAAASAD